MIEVLLVRHGEAVDDAPGLGDAGRWLTPAGRETTRRVARLLAKDRAQRPAEIWTSPLVRAVQTAEILAERVKRGVEVTVRRELTPGEDEEAVLAILARYEGKGPIALVGHEPQLSAIAVSLLPGVEWPGLKKSGVLGVAWNGAGAGVMRFLLQPKKKKLKVVTELPARAG